MRRSRYPEGQIIAILNEHEAGLAAAELCRKYGVSDATFYRWRRKFGGMEVSDAKKLKAAWEGTQKGEIQRIVQAVKSALPTATFEEVGDRATMPFGVVGTVQLLREHGVWKIEDFD